MNTGAAKAAARAAAKSRLQALTPAERAAASERIAREVWHVPAVAAARTLLLYAALPSEVATGAIAAEAARRGLVVTYPRCLPELRALTFHHVRDAADLRKAAYGIAEPDPVRCPLVELDSIDAALVPGLAWDRAGNRLGRGAGYYDRAFALPEWRALRCGLFFACQEVAALPADSWDVPLDVIVTEGGVYRPGAALGVSS